MPSWFTHASIAVIGLLRPDIFSFYGLLAGSLAPDVEVVFKYANSILRKEVHSLTQDTDQGILHTVLGLIIILPAASASAFLLAPASLSYVVLSVLIGWASHLLLDIPGHKEFILFYPKKIHNKFQFRKRYPLLEKLMPVNDVPEDVMYAYNWFMVTHIVALIAVFLWIVAS